MRIEALDGGASNTTVCQTHRIKHSTLIDTLMPAGRSAGMQPP
jgi:hypothetical protein